MQDLRGTQIGPYRLEQELARTSAVRSFVALQTALNRRVVVKILGQGVEGDPALVDRFKREASAISRLRHPHIAAVHDFGEEGGYLYLATEYVDGGSLADRLSGPIPVQQTYLILSQVAAALDYAHSRGVSHRNLKSANVLLVERGGQRLALDFNYHPWILLGDFSLARVFEGAVRDDVAMGYVNPYYMSPEQALGRTADKSSDIYSLAIIAFEMLTGTVPFGGESALEVANKHMTEPLPSPRLVVPNLPEQLDRVLEQGAAKRPADRYRSAGDFADDFARALGIEPGPRENPLADDRAVTSDRRFGLPSEDVPSEEEDEEEEEKAGPIPRKYIVPIAGGVGGLIVVCFSVFCLLNWVMPAVSAAVAGNKPSITATPTLTAASVARTATAQALARTPTAAAIPSVTPLPPATPTPQNDSQAVQNVVRESNLVWSRAVGKGGATTELSKVFGGRWLEITIKQVNDLRTNNQYRDAQLVEIRFDNVEVSGTRATVRTTERWNDTLRGASGNLITTNPPVVNQIYTLEKGNSGWLVTDSSIVRPG